MKTAVKILKDYTIFVMLIILAVMFTMGNPAFISSANIITILRQSCILGICAMGQMTILIVGGVNLSMGSSVSLTTVFIALLTVRMGIPWPIAFALAIVMCSAIGFATGFIIVKAKIVPMIGTIAISILISGLSYIVCGGLPISGLSDATKWFYRGSVGPIPVPIIIWFIVILVFAVMFKYTYFGRHIFITGSNAEAARLSGINTTFIWVSAYTICGALAGLAGLLMLGRLGSGQPTAAETLDMDVLAALIIGGVSFMGGEGKISKAVGGIVLIALLKNGMTLNGINEYVQRVVTGAVFLSAVCLDAFQHRPKKPTLFSTPPDTEKERAQE
jgi:Ribose/xylose/arabinose/galactoside ABC-type transport systems, permease components